MRLTWVLLVSLTGRAAAESDAEKHFHEGKRLLKAHLLIEACAAFARSHDLTPKAGTLLNLGDCQEQRGQTATARETFVQAKALAVQHGDKTREAEAERRIAALEPTLSTLTLVVPADIAALGPTIYRNDASIGPGGWNRPTVTDPDTYTIRVSARGYREWSTPSRLEPKQHARVVVGPLVAVTAIPAPVLPARELTSAIATEAAPRRFALGVLLGMNVQHESGVVGIRTSGAFDAPGGQIRAIGTFHVSRYPDEPGVHDNYRTTTYSVGANADYLWLPRPGFGMGGGLGIGADYDAVNPTLTEMQPDGPRTSDLGSFLTVRLTPIVLRLRHETVEAGLHIGAVIAGDEVTINAAIAVDWFLW